MLVEKQLFAQGMVRIDLKLWLGDGPRNERKRVGNEGLPTPLAPFYNYFVYTHAK